MQATPQNGTFSDRIPLVRSFQFSLVVAFVLVALLPLLLLASLTISQQVSQAQAQTITQLESVVELKNNQISLWLDEAMLAADFITADDLFRVDFPSMLTDDAARPQADLDRLNAHLAGLLTINTYFERFMVYDTSGVVRFAAVPSDRGRVITTEPYFAASVDEENYIQTPFVDLGTSELNMVITRRLINQRREIVGVFAAQMNLSVLANIMTQRVGLGETGETYLVSQTNSLLLTPSRFRGYAINRSYDSAAISESLARGRGSGIYDNYQSPPERVVGVYRWIPELEAGLIAEVREEQILVGVRQAQTNLLLIGISAALLALIGGLIYARQIARPVVSLTGAARQLAAGDMTVRASMNTRSEIGVLAHSFNAMADGIEERQRELTALNQSLERRVAERTEQLKIARDEALASQRIAQDNSRLKSEFLSTMSHELRTPLNAIEGFTSIMLSGMGIELSPRAEDMVKRVSANSKRLLALINDFLDLSRIEAGRLELTAAPVSPRALVEKWERQVGVLAEEKGLKFVTWVDPALPDRLLVDEDALSKIALNLLSNAFKFTQHGEVTLTLSQADDMWSITVSDTGIGIPAHAREYIFEEFRQVDGSSKRLYGGTGLGLALVQKLTRAMGGSVALVSEVGQGSTFTITLPLITEATREESVTA